MTAIKTLFTATFLLAYLSGCSFLPQKDHPTYGEWSFSGKMAIKHISEETSQATAFNVNWAQQGEHYQIELSGPLGQGAVSISGQPGNVTLTKGKETWNALNLTELAYQVTNLDLPLDYLQFWVRGEPKPDEVSQILATVDGLTTQINQAGWEVMFSDYFSDSTTLPRKLSFVKADNSGKLIIKQWVSQTDSP